MTSANCVCLVRISNRMKATYILNALHERTTPTSCTDRNQQEIGIDKA